MVWLRPCSGSRTSRLWTRHFNELWARRRPLLPGKWWRRAGSVAREGLGSCDQELQGSLTRSLEAHA